MQHEPDQLIASAQAHYAMQFPNPERIGCPAPGQLTSMVWTGQLPTQPLRQHLFSCSECFQEYREQVAAYRQKSARQPASAWWHIWQGGWRIKAAFAFFAALIAVLGGWLLWQPAPPQLAPNDQVALAPRPQENPPIGDHKPTPPVSPVEAAPRSAQAYTRTIDLNEYVALRDVKAGVTEEKKIRLPSERVRLQLNLPEGSTKGAYTIRLIDAFGRPLSRATATSQRGNTFTVRLDLRPIKANTYRLEVSRRNEAPDYYPVTVTEKHSKQK